VQQAVRVKGVVDAAAAFGPESKAHLGAALADVLADGGLLFGRGAVFLRQVLGNILAARRHLRVQLEGFEMQRGLHLPGGLFKRPLERAQTHRAPGAGDVGHKIDTQGNRLGHGGSEKAWQWANARQL
jgi:hypothetical protein